jgi:hypothetical protein
MAKAKRKNSTKTKSKTRPREGLALIDATHHLSTAEGSSRDSRVSFFFPGDGCLAEAREYLMPEKLDPARNLVGHVTAELAEAKEAA